MVKNRKDAGADNLTPSVPQYFSWINNTNEGSTEGQTLVNLEFFRWLRERYGMEIKIYAWDSGNFDGASRGYGDVNSAKFKAQYPEGYKNVVKRAAELGIRFGLWGSPDGYGDDEESERERFEFFVHLCRDYHFAEFKLDGVCGTLREEKAPIFAEMLRECRKYSPDLIVLNHRLNLFEAEKHVTTSLMNGQETYTDVLIRNSGTAMHNRAYMFTRGHTENLDRLQEDHGVCISSCIDYFEDELVYQAFNRSLILAPEMYGNPWLMRDDEFPKLARVYNLHKANAKILVNGLLLPESCGCEAVSRGDGSKRYISTGNDSWETKKIKLTLGGEIGLSEGGRYYVNLRHPYECRVGEFELGDTVEIELMPFRATLVEIAKPERADPVLVGCEYEMIRENESGEPVEVKIVKTDGGEIDLLSGGNRVRFASSEPIDIKEKPPVRLGSLNQLDFDRERGKYFAECALFAVSNDSLERKSLLRAGETAIPEVKAARDAFFGQATYRLRGCEAKNLFDGRCDTFFDSQSRCYCDRNLRIDGGCLRVDFGGEYDADTLEIDYFSAHEPTRELPPQKLNHVGECSTDLKKWRAAQLESVDAAEKGVKVPVIRFTVHTIYDAEGDILRASYRIGGKLRCFKLPEPVDRIYAIRLIKDGAEVELNNPTANNMLSPTYPDRVRLIKEGSFTLPEYRSGSRLAVAIEGKTGQEEVTCTAEIDGEVIGFPQRAPEYVVNQWEHCVCGTDGYYTFYLPLRDGLCGKKVKIRVTFSDEGKADIPVDVYLCDRH